MMCTRKVLKAINLASRLHNGQSRKGDSGLPYISHPFGVACILSGYTKEEDVIIAGLLHDALEDVKGYYYDDLVKDFGPRVAQIVKAVSEDKDPNVDADYRSNWEERKLKYLAALEEGSREALLVCAADKTHNLYSMIDAYAEQGEKFWDHFNFPEGKKLWFFYEVLKVLKRRLDSPIVAELEKAYKLAEEIL